MAWNHDDVGPTRSRDELLGQVVRRGEGLRRRQRLAGGLGGGIALLLAVAGVVAVVGPGDDSGTQVAAGGSAPHTLNQSRQASATGGATFAVEAPTTTATPAAAATVVAPRASTTVAPLAAAAGAPSTTLAPAAVPTLPQPGQPRCSPTELEVSIALPPSFRQGEQVTGPALLRNTSGAPCYFTSYTQSQQFRDGGGNPVGPGSALIADNFADTAFAPGQTLTAAPAWDQQVCPSGPVCSSAPVGTYSVTVTWSFDGPPVESTAVFQIVP